MPSARSSSFTHTAEPEQPAVSTRPFAPSAYQRAIFDWFKCSGVRFGNTRPEKRNLIVRARAGTGKTTTILHAIDRAPEENILLAAFNKRIQEELAERLTNPHAVAKTLHSLGYQAIRRNGGVTRTCRRFEREDDIANAVTGGMPYGAKRLVGKLSTKAREIQPLGATVETLVELAYDFNLVPPPGDALSVEAVASATLRALHYAASVRPVATGIDYADMIFLPLVNNWTSPDYDMVVVDEAQDMTISQLTLALRSCRPGGRIVLVGDDRQAIYGFRGADSGSLDRLKKELDAEELPLSQTYRCPRAVVAIAQRIVPDYLVGDDAPEGIVDTVETLDELVSTASVGDFVLSRRNAPLARVALRLLRAGTSARIQGRDIGASLKALVQQLATGHAANSIPAFLGKLAEYETKQRDRFIAAKHEDRIDELSDRCATLYWLAQDATGVPGLLMNISELFVDDLGAYVVCSSVHKAKGLEAERVFVLRSTFFMPPTCVNCGKRLHKCTCREFEADPDQAREENNIFYVAVTRAKSHLTWCLEKF